jgi:hypothetical protein
MALAEASQPTLPLNRSILPYGTTLHYRGCGCPNHWKRGARAADVVDLLLQRCHQLYQQKLLSANRPLRVVYMLPHHNITGVVLKILHTCIPSAVCIDQTSTGVHDGMKHNTDSVAWLPCAPLIVK